MAEVLLYVGKINLTAAIVILLTALISEIVGHNYSAGWKYRIWLMLGILMLLPVRIPENWNMVQIEVPLSYSDSLKVCRKMKVKHIPELMLNSRLETPLLSGFLHPCICLPADGYTAEEQELIFFHELCHYRRKDLWYKLFLEWLCTLYWFNPVLWWMKGEAERNIEFLCDETVMQSRTVSEKLIYSRLLAKTAAGKKSVQGIFTGLNDSLITLKKRMVNIMCAGRLKKGTAITVSLLMIFFLGNSLMGCSFREDDEADAAMSVTEIPSGEVSPEPKNREEETGRQQEDEIQSTEPQILDSEPFSRELQESYGEQTSGADYAEKNPNSASAEENEGNPENLISEEEEETESEEIHEQAGEAGNETGNTVSPEVTPEPVATEVPKTPEPSAPDIELLDYMNSNQVQEFADTMGLQQIAGQMFGESGMRYESSEIGIEWQYKDESFYDWGIDESKYDFIGSVWCEGNTELGVYGIACGMDIGEARSRMISDNWRVIGNGQRAFLKEDATGYNREYVQFETDGTEIVRWYWCNWPEGDV